MRTPALQFSLLAAALSPTLVQAAPTPFTPSTPFSPSKAPDSPRPVGNFARGGTLAPRSGGLGLGFVAARDIEARKPSFLGSFDDDPSGTSFAGIGSGNTLLGVLDEDDMPPPKKHHDSYQQAPPHNNYYKTDPQYNEPPPSDPYYEDPAPEPYYPDAGNVDYSQPAQKEKDCDDDYGYGKEPASDPYYADPDAGNGYAAKPSDDPYYANPDAGNVDYSKPADDGYSSDPYQPDDPYQADPYQPDPYASDPYAQPDEDCADDMPYKEEPGYSDDPYYADPNAGYQDPAKPGYDDGPAVIDPAYPDPGDAGEDCDDPGYGNSDPYGEDPGYGYSDDPYAPDAGNVDYSQPADDGYSDDPYQQEPSYEDPSYEDPSYGEPAYSDPEPSYSDPYAEPEEDCGCEDDGYDSYKPKKGGLAAAKPADSYDPPADSYDPSYDEPTDDTNYNATDPTYEDPAYTAPKKGNVNATRPSDSNYEDPNSNYGDPSYEDPTYAKPKKGNMNATKPSDSNYEDPAYATPQQGNKYAAQPYDPSYDEPAYGAPQQGNKYAAQPNYDQGYGDDYDDGDSDDKWNPLAGNVNLGLPGMGNGKHGSIIASGDGGNARGGDVQGPSGLVNVLIDSDNAGDGGEASSGDALNLPLLKNLNRARSLVSRSLAYGGIFGRRMFRSAATPEQAHEMEEMPAEIHPIYPDHPKRSHNVDAVGEDMKDEGMVKSFVPRGSTKRL